MSLPSYTHYKSSGVDWLGNVPSHWDIHRLKDISRVINGYPFDSKLFADDGEFPVLRIRDLNAKETATRYNGEFIESVGITSSDVLIGMDGDFNVGRWLGDEIALLNQRMCCVRTNSLALSTFLLHALPYPLKALNEVTYATTVKHLSSLDVEKLKISLPRDDEELRAIASSLDCETTKIDALIAEQEKFITLLAEKRQATISHAVTKGLDPEAPVRESGVNWLDKIPAHWNVSPLKHFVELKSGGTPSKDNLAYWNGDIPWASAKDVKTETLSTTLDRITRYAIESGAADIVPEGAVLVVVRGMILARTFPVALTNAPMAINQDLKAILPLAGLYNRFLAWVLRGSATESLQRLDEAGHGTKALRMEAWTSMRIPLPPLAEQERIAAFLDAQTARIDCLSAQSERAIELLKERRSALIAAAVTGQIDVRGEVLQPAVEEEFAA